VPGDGRAKALHQHGLQPGFQCRGLALPRRVKLVPRLRHHTQGYAFRLLSVGGARRFGQLFAATKSRADIGGNIQKGDPGVTISDQSDVLSHNRYPTQNPAQIEAGDFL